MAAGNWTRVAGGWQREGGWDEVTGAIEPLFAPDGSEHANRLAEIQSQKALEADPMGPYRSMLSGLQTYQNVREGQYGTPMSADGRILARPYGTSGYGYDVNDLNRVLPNWRTLSMGFDEVTGNKEMFSDRGVPEPSKDDMMNNPLTVMAAAFGVNALQGAGFLPFGDGAGLGLDVLTTDPTGGLAMGSGGAASTGASAVTAPSLALGVDLGSGYLTGPGTIADIAAGAYSGAAPLSTAGVNLGGIAEMANVAAGLPAAGAASTGLPWLDFMTAHPGKVVNLANTAGTGIAPAAGLGLVNPMASKSILDQVTEDAKKTAPYAPLIGGALGAGAGLLGGSKPAGTITVEEDIPDWLKGYMKPALDKYSTELQNHNTDPFGIMPAAQKEFLDTVSGLYLDPSTNKYLPEYFRLGAERVKGTLSPSFGHMQAFGSNTGYNEALSRGLSDLAVGLYGGAYEKERNRQSQMTASAPSFLASAAQSKFAPYTDYINTLSGLGKKKEQPYFNNQFSNVLGGALAGYGLGNFYK